MPASLKLLRTSTFRLAALYLILFALSVVALLAYVYWNTTVLLERQTDDTIRAEILGLADQYRERGLDGMIETIQRRSREDTSSIYLLTAPSGQPVAGNLNALPPQASTNDTWFEFPLDVKHGGVTEHHIARAYHTDLTGDYELVVGRDVAALRQFASIIRNIDTGCPGHCPGAGFGRRIADEPQFSPPCRCHHRRQPLDHGRKFGRPHAGYRHRR